MSNLPAIRPSGRNEPLSSLLRRLADGPPGPMRVRDMVDHFGHAAFGAVLFTFALPNALPLPPGSSSVLGLPLVIVAPQLAFGIKSPWIPRAVADRTIQRAALVQAFAKVLPKLERVERLCQPRLDFMFSPIGLQLVGGVCTLLSLILILPIPLGNMLPAAAISTLALSLTQRDGVVAAAGYVMAVASFGLVVLSAGAVIAVFRHIGQILGL